MSIQKFRSFEEAEKALWEFRPDGNYYTRLRAFFLLAQRLHPIQPQPGIQKFKNIDEKKRSESEPTTKSEVTLPATYLRQMKELVLRVTSDLDCTIFLFGSRASAAHRRSSDIDIGFSGLSESEFTKTRDGLLSELEESVIPHHVDLVNFDTASSDFREIALKEIIIWKQSSRAN